MGLQKVNPYFLISLGIYLIMRALVRYWMSSGKKIKNEDYLYIQEKYVDQVYNDIAEHFDHTRFARWPRVKAFLNSL